MKSDMRLNKVTYFTDVAGCCLSTSVIIELVVNTSVHLDAVLVAAVVVRLVEAPVRVATCNPLSHVEQHDNVTVKVQIRVIENHEESKKLMQ